MIASTEQLKLTRQEGLKAGNPLLAGGIIPSLNDEGADHFSEDDYEFLKYHGVYQQDDRDKRKTGKHYQMMVRTKFPGGVLSPGQYVACDRLSLQFGNNTLRITTRQDFQFHGVLKSNLRQVIKNLNEALISTLAACGDVERNIMAPPTPATGPLVEEVLTQARALSARLAPQTPAYHGIWIEGRELDLQEGSEFVDPLYGKHYLPRKFKTAFAIPPLNDIDVFTNDLGFVAIVGEREIRGYNVLAGGGMGMSHGNAETFPRLADVIGFVGREHVEAVAKAVIGIHRDFGDRTNRKHARLKYVIAERGLDWFRCELEQRAGVQLEPACPFTFTRQGDLLGWHEQANGKWFLGLFVENGRIQDSGAYRLKSGLRRVVEQFQPEVRLTPSQNILLVNLRPEDKAEVEQALREYGIPVEAAVSRTRLASMACPALPTCGLALAESERFAPGLLSRLEGLLNEVGLGGEELIVRMTGCPNGCARPYTAELAFVGKAPNKYQIYVGGNEGSTRLNRLYKDSVKADDLMQELRPLLVRYAVERQRGERFGDFCARTVWTAATAA